MELDKALAVILDGDGVLFVGAGFSLGAKNTLRAQMPTARQLAEALSDELGFPSPVDLDDASQAYINDPRFGETRLAERILAEFTCTSTTESQDLITQLPWRRIYTTNYDDVIEKSVGAYRRFRSVTTGSRFDDQNDSDLLCVHLNGFVDTLRDSKIFPSDFRLTSQQYLSTDLRDNQWLQLFRSDLQRARAVFFVGYSLYDLDLKRVLFASGALRDKTFFYVGNRSSAADEIRFQLFGTIDRSGTDGLVTHIANMQRLYRPRGTPVLETPSFEQSFAVPSILPEISDEAVNRLILRGDTDDRLLWRAEHGAAGANSASPSRPYSFHRELVGQVVGSLDAGTPFIVVHARIANGKTVLLRTLRVVLADKKIPCFFFKYATRTSLVELGQILSSHERAVIVAEFYYDSFDLVREFALLRKRGHHIILTGRTPQHETSRHKLYEYIGNANTDEFDANRLSTADIARLDSLLEVHGLWGELAARGPQQRTVWIRNTCRSEISGILLALFKSERVLAGFRELVSDIRKNDSCMEIMLSAMIIQHVGGTPDIELLAEIVGDAKLNDMKVRRNEALNEFVSFSTGHERIACRSSAVGIALLRYCLDGSEVQEALVKLARRLDALSVEGGRQLGASFEELLKKLMKFPTLQRLVSETDADDEDDVHMSHVSDEEASMIIGFYESVKALRRTKDNPLFWLHYAMARMYLKHDYEVADKYFQTSYAMAKRRAGFDTYQIDNHRARFLIESAIYYRDCRDGMRKLRAASTILLRQTQRRQERHYPYRVAARTKEFVETFLSELTPKDRRVIGDFAQRVLAAVAKALPDVQSHRSVVECVRALHRVTELVGNSEQA